MRFGLVLAALAAFALVTPSVAQESDERSPAQRAAEAAEATAEGETMLRTANAADLFVNESPQSEFGTILLRHRNSGLQCSFDPGARNRVIVFPTLARGEDVGCDGNSGELNFTFYATRYPTRTTVAEEIDGAVEAMRSRMSDLRPYQPDVDIDPRVVARVHAALPGMETRSFTTRMNGRDFFTRVSVVIVGEWVIKMRATGPRNERNERAAEMLWLTRTAVSFRPELAGRGSSPPPISAPPVSAPPADDASGGK